MIARPADEPTPEERRAFAAASRDLIADRIQSGLPTAIAVALALGPAAFFGYPQARAGAVLPPLGAAFLMTLAVLSARLRSVRRHVVALTGLVVNGVTIFAALAAVHTGVWASPYTMIMLLAWIFVTAFLPVSPRQVNQTCIPMPFVFAGVLWLHGEEAIPPAVLAVILAGSHLYSYFGVVSRHRAAMVSHVAQSRLAEARERLTALNRSLEERVEEQVGETLQRAKEIETLNAQLRHEVRERSQELALTLQRLDDERGFSDLVQGSVLAGRVQLKRQLGSGAMGAVYAGIDLATGDPVAVKLMAGESSSPARVRRFMAEAEAAASVDHPVIVKTLAIDVDEEGRPFQLLELVEGDSLQAIRKKRGRLAAAEVAAIGARLASGLAAAHAAGVVHRDIKPTNVLIQREEPRVRLVDFGIAKQVRSTILAPTLTAPGQIIGTPAYMAPEQIEAASVITPAADIYALGVMLYELIAGALPFAATGPALLVAAITMEPMPLSELVPDAPPKIAAMLMRCLARDPEARPSARQLAELLEVESLDATPPANPSIVPPVPQSWAPAPRTEMETLSLRKPRIEPS